MTLVLVLTVSGCTRRMAPVYAGGAVAMVGLAVVVDRGYRGDSQGDGLDLEGIPLMVGLGAALALGVAALVASQQPDDAPDR